MKKFLTSNKEISDELRTVKLMYVQFLSRNHIPISAHLIHEAKEYQKDLQKERSEIYA